MKISKDNIFNLTGGAFGMVLVTTIGFAFMFVFFPLYSDDFMYMEPMLDYIDHGESPWQGLWENWSSHYYLDNFRLSNIVFTLFLLLPKWIGCTLSGIGIFLTLRIMLRIACGNENTISIWTAIWMCMLFTFGLPWFDQIVIMCFQFNYVWPGFLALLCLSIFIGNTRCNPWLVFILGFITGWWHEGFSVPEIAGFVILMLIWHKCFVTRTNIILFIGIIAGLSVLVLAPSFIYRINQSQASDLTNNFFPTLLYSLRYYIPGIIFVILGILMLFSKQTRHLILSPLCAFIMICLMINYAIHIRTFFAARIGWWANICSILGIVYLTYNYIKINKLSITKIKIFKVVSVIGAVFMTAHLVFADVMTVKMKKDMDSILNRYAATPDIPGQVIFADFTDQISAPFFSLQKPYYNIFNYSWNSNQCVRWRYEKKYPLSVVPTQLEYVNGTQGDLLPSGVRRIAKNIYYVSCDKTYESITASGKILLRGHYTPSLFYCTSFISKADGKRYLYIYPSNMSLRSLGTSIDDIVLEKFMI